MSVYSDKRQALRVATAVAQILEREKLTINQAIHTLIGLIVASARTHKISRERLIESLNAACDYMTDHSKPLTCESMVAGLCTQAPTTSIRAGGSLSWVCDEHAQWFKTHGLLDESQ